MRLGKVKSTVEQRSVLRQLHNKSPYGSPRSGEDAGSFDLACVRSCMAVHTVDGRTLAGRRAVYEVTGKLTASGAVPEAVSFSILMPEGTEESELKSLIHEIDRHTQECGVTVVGCQAAVSSSVKSFLITASGIGETKYFHDFSAEPLSVVMAGHAAREGTAVIAREGREELLTRYPDYFISEAAFLYDDYLYGLIAEAARECPPAMMHIAGQGGIFGGLWELAGAAGVGLDVRMSAIPIRQHTVEVCEFYHLNPYVLLSGGCVLMLCENGERMRELLEDKGIPAAIIGRTTDTNARIVRYDEEIRYLEPPKTDEYYRWILREKSE